MLRLLALLSLALPVSGQGLYLVPSEFVVSPGQRISVAIEGAKAVADLHDATLYTPVAAYNITNLRSSTGAVLGDANIKSKGTLILSIRTAHDFAKALIVSAAPSDFCTRPVGLALEIVPEKNPSDLLTTGELPLMVLQHDQPSAGIAVKTSSGFTGRTDAHGRVKVPVPASGVLRILAVSSEEDLSSSLVLEIR